MMDTFRGWRYASSGYVLANQPDNDEEMIEHHFENEIYCLAWDGIKEILYCGEKKGVINIWNLQNWYWKTSTQEWRAWAQTYFSHHGIQYNNHGVYMYLPRIW